MNDSMREALRLRKELDPDAPEMIGLGAELVNNEEKMLFTKKEVERSIKNGWAAGHKAGRQSVFADQKRAIFCIFVGVLILCAMKYLGWL